MKCNPEIEVVFRAVRKIVDVRGVEPKPGFVQNELSVALANGVEVSIEGRCGRGKGIPIVRFNGNVVAHGFDGTLKRGAWERELSTTLEAIWHDEMHALALPGCPDCHGFGTILIAQRAITNQLFSMNPPNRWRLEGAR